MKKLKRPLYFIENKDEPKVLWEYEEENEYGTPKLYAYAAWDKRWTCLTMVNTNFNVLSTDELFRRIPKREAKSLFPEAFKSV